MKVSTTIVDNGKPSTPKSFLRWIGGKRLLINKLFNYLPQDWSKRRYFEPFAGAANLFFRLRPEKAVLADLNEPLIECYKQVRDRYPTIAGHIREHKKNNSKEYYYKIRDIYNHTRYGPAQAARFIYLNQTCFNGIFRVNLAGKYNVPYGDKVNPQFPSTNELAEASKTLKNATLLVSDFEDSLSNAQSGDFIYLDPPYPPLNGTSYFTHYTRDRFTADNQVRLASVVRDLERRGCLFLMTNADLPNIRKLYSGFNIFEMSVTRYVSCKSSRYQVSELVITNYDA